MAGIARHKEGTRASQGFRNNYHGGKTVKGEGAVTMCVGSRQEQSRQWKMPHTGADGSVGVGAMKVCKPNGDNMTKKK